jgi:hypothetical protein
VLLLDSDLQQFQSVMKVIPETCHVHWILYLHFYYFFLIATHLIKQFFGKSLNDLEERWYLLIYELSNLRSDWKNDICWKYTYAFQLLDRHCGNISFSQYLWILYFWSFVFVVFFSHWFLSVEVSLFLVFLYRFKIILLCLAIFLTPKFKIK